MQERSVDEASKDKSSKTTQLLLQFYSKAAQIIVQSRISVLQSYDANDYMNKKQNKWFNLEMDEFQPLKDELKFWKSQLQTTAHAPPLIIDILLDISQMSPYHILILTGNNAERETINFEGLSGFDNSKRPIQKKKILLETWQLTLSYTTY
jgi:hypothetical protein